MGAKPTCSTGNIETFGLSATENYHIHDFYDPRSSLDIKGHLSGRQYKLKFLGIKDYKILNYRDLEYL